MNILVINAWSSSLKFQLFDMKKNIVKIKWIVEKISTIGSFIKYEIAGKSQTIKISVKTHKKAMQVVVKVLKKEFKDIKISAVGHRIVHGGEYFQNSIVIDKKIIDKIKKCSDLAPLHNPAGIAWIIACKELFPRVPHIAVFDTSFYQGMKPENYIYPLPYTFYSKYKIRRYWFHGTSHRYVYEQLPTKLKQWKVITCHIWNGASITAIKWGKVVETSMGMTPLEWLMMGTRSGNIDPAIIFHLTRYEKLSIDQIEDILEEKSGLLGVSGESWDMREILAGIKKKNKRCELALKIYLNSITKYIWAYTALMNGVDTIVLTAGVMEGSYVVRKLLMKKLERLGITLDNKKNNSSIIQKVISTPRSKVNVIVIPTNEELEIAKETKKLIQ